MKEKELSSLRTKKLELDAHENHEEKIKDFQNSTPHNIKEVKEKKQNYRNFARKHKF